MTREMRARARDERMPDTIMAGFRAINLSHQTGQHDAVMEGVNVRTHMHLYAAIFALWNMVGGANLHFGNPPTWRPRMMTGRVSIEFDTRFKAAYHLLQKSIKTMMQAFGQVTVYNQGNQALVNSAPAEAPSDPSFWDKLMASTRYRNEISMLRVADYVMRHLAVTMVLLETGVTTQLAVRGSLRGPFPSWVPAWADNNGNDSCIHGNFFLERLAGRLQETRDLAWRILQRMNALDLVFHPPDENLPLPRVTLQDDEESEDDYNFLDEDD